MLAPESGSSVLLTSRRLLNPNPSCSVTSYYFEATSAVLEIRLYPICVLCRSWRSNAQCVFMARHQTCRRSEEKDTVLI